MSDKIPVTIRFEPSTIEALDHIADKYSVSRSVLIRSKIRSGLDPDDPDFERELIDAVPESTLKLSQRQAKMSEIMDAQELKEKKHSFDDRVIGYFKARLEGDAAYTPEGMEDLAEGYKLDASVWFDDAEDVREKEDLVDEWLSWYDMGYFAREHAHTVETEVNSSDVSGGWFEVGRDLHKLRERLDEVVSHIRDVADREGVGYDSDAVVESIARTWSVCEGAVLLLLEHMVAEPDGTIADALVRGGDRLVDPTSLAPELNGESEVDALPEGAVIRTRDPDALSRMESHTDD